MKNMLFLLLCLLILLNGCTTPQREPTFIPQTTPLPALSETPEPTPPRTYLLNSNGTLGFGLKSFYFSGRCERKDDTLFQAIYQSLTDSPWTTGAEGVAHYGDYLPNGLEADGTKNNCYIPREISLTDMSQAAKHENLQIVKCVREDLTSLISPSKIIIGMVRELTPYCCCSIFRMGISLLMQAS